MDESPNVLVTAFVVSLVTLFIGGVIYVLY